MMIASVVCFFAYDWHNFAKIILHQIIQQTVKDAAHCVEGDAGASPDQDKNMMERRFTLLTMVRLDPAVTVKNSSVLTAAKRRRGDGAEPNNSSREKSSLWQQKKAISFNLENNNEQSSKYVQAGFPRTWQLVSSKTYL